MGEWEYADATCVANGMWENNCLLKSDRRVCPGGGAGPYPGTPGELLQQAADKIAKTTGLLCATEKAEQSCLGSWFRVVVGSVQTLMRESRLRQFAAGYFNTIIIDEAHHCITDSYQNILKHFHEAKVLGVTATPDRGDMKNLGSVFQSLAYEYTLQKAIKEGYLTPIRAQTIPLRLDLTGVGIQGGDFKMADLGCALDPYLYQIADEMKKYCVGRKTVVFLPLVKTSQKFRDILQENGFRAVEVNGESKERAEILKGFEEGAYDEFHAFNRRVGLSGCGLCHRAPPNQSAGIVCADGRQGDKVASGEGIFAVAGFFMAYGAA